MIDTTKQTEPGTTQTVQLQASDRSQLEARLRRAADAVVRTAMRCVEAAGNLAHDHGDSVQRATARVAGTVDEKTNGKYAPKVARAQAGVQRGVTKVAGYRAR